MVRDTPRMRVTATWRGWTSTTALVALTTIVGIVGRAHLMLPDLVALYLLTITVAATVYGRGPSILATTLAVLAYDFFFVPPVFTFAVTDLRHILTFVVMFVVGVVIGGLMSRIRRQELEAKAREVRIASLYALSQDLSRAEDEPEAASLFARRGKETFQVDVSVFVLDGTGHLASSGSSATERTSAEGERRIVEDRLRGALEHEGSSRDRAELRYLPLRSGATLLGALTFSPPLTLKSSEEARFLAAFAQQGALALHRTSLKKQAEEAALKARVEEMRSALLSTVSHDLRTPLAAITGAATTLRDTSLLANRPQQRELLDTICEEADRLERLVRNLLDMTMVESGALPVKREWVPIEEIVGSALTRLESMLSGRSVEIMLSPELPLLSVDTVLLQQVFLNLLENAVKYTPAKSKIEIRAHAIGNSMVINVDDRGPGLPPGGDLRIFEKFFRADTSSVSGAGLGLAICRGVVEAHGGTISAENRVGGGTSFTITLPISGDAPFVPADVGVASVGCAS